MSFMDILNNQWVAQLKQWPSFAQSVDTLNGAAYRWLQLPQRGRFVLLQSNTVRLHLSSANLDPDVLEKRPVKARPAEQTALQFGDFEILCNIAPILAPHYTIVSLAHGPQYITRAVNMMVDFAQKCDGEMLVFFNGIGAGATAPDHLHCQAIRANILPFDWWLRGAVSDDGWQSRPEIWPFDDGDEEEEEDDEELPARSVEWLTTMFSDVRLGVTRGGIVPAVIIVGNSNICDAILHVIHCCVDVLPRSETPMEPPVNVYVGYLEDSEQSLAWVVPRPRFRPSFYGRFMVSPGAVDLADFVLAPRKEDFDRIEGTELLQGLNEVVLSAVAYESLISRMLQL